jgi:6-pyruvoyltetrahydropterin/6-carboxytetrahydropterin synthase
MFTISKQFSFSASHRLLTLSENHPCYRLHGHNYVVELELQADTLDEHGFVVDYNALKPFKQMLDETLDHRHLNEVLDFEPTAENLAFWLYNWAKMTWPQTVAVRVRETPTTCAEYRNSR